MHKDEDLLKMVESGNVLDYQKATLENLEQTASKCSQCGQDFYSPACGPTHALIAHERGLDKKTVCILTPFRNARGYLSLYFSQMVSLQEALKVEGFSMRIVAAEGDSLDGTRERLLELSKTHNINLSVVDTTHGHMRWASVEDPVRLKVMSDVMNKALDQVKESDNIVVWIMSDLKWETHNLLWLIKCADQDREKGFIYTPMAMLSEEIFYDTWAYRALGKRFSPTHPYYEYYSESEGCQFIDSAGTCLVMPSQIALHCRADKDEAVSFCQDADSKGYRVVLDTEFKFYHAPIPRKRLLWISDAVCMSGFSRVAHAMFPLLAEAGYDLDIIATNYWGEPHNYPYRIYPATVQGEDISGNLRVKYLVYAAQMEGKPYDLIVKLDDPWNFQGLKNALGQLEEKYQVPSPPVLAWVTVDGENIKGEEIDFIKRIACSSEFGASEVVRHRYESNNAMVSPNISVVPFGVDTSIFKPLDKAESRSLVSSSEIPIDCFIVGTVGANQHRKRLDLVLSYFSAWIDQYNVNDAYLYLCVGREDPTTGCDIKSLVKFYGLQSRVILNTELLSDQALAHVYSAFDVFISLPLGEGFGLCALEAMACGVPCIVSNWAAYSTWVPEEVAYKIPCTSTAMSSPLNAKSYVVGGVADKEETVGALQKLYMYPELRESMGRSGVEFAARMSWKEAGNMLLKEMELAQNTKQPIQQAGVTFTDSQKEAIREISEASK